VSDTTAGDSSNAAGSLAIFLKLVQVYNQTLVGNFNSSKNPIRSFKKEIANPKRKQLCRSATASDRICGGDKSQDKARKRALCLKFI
jgi:hypothetical protein